MPRTRSATAKCCSTSPRRRGSRALAAKRLGSTYQPGKRSPNWRKIKHRRKVEVVIGGFTQGGGNRESTFGALLVGRWDGDWLGVRRWGRHGLRSGDARGDDGPAGRPRTGRLPVRPAPPTSYRRGAHWVEPVLTAEVEITEFTNDGLVRHATFITLT
ncbi:MAG: hypothetical protein R2697_18525 [Ilumatobacteraceae bacterium]